VKSPPNGARILLVMALRTYISVFLALSLLSACSSKSGPVKTSVNKFSSVRKIKNPMSQSKGFFYADVQIITKTTPEGKCDKSKSIEERIAQGKQVIIGKDGKLKINVGRTGLDSAYNVSIQGIGFDSSRYDFTALNGKSPKHLPYKLNFKKKPGNIIKIEFLDQSIKMNLDQDTIYTFFATEKRGNCSIKHSVNVFVEQSGVYAMRW